MRSTATRLRPLCVGLLLFVLWSQQASGSAASAPLRAQEPPAPEQVTAEPEPISFSWSTMEPLTDGDADLWVFQMPVIKDGENQFRATWAIFWVSPGAQLLDLSKRSGVGEEDLRLGQPFEPAEPPAVSGESPGANLLKRMFAYPMLSEVREAYFEGPVEYFEQGRRVAFADAMYLDRIGGHGWIRGGNYSFKDRLGGSDYVVKVQADWLRISADGSLGSRRARLTTSEFGVPSYYIMTGDLRMRRTPDPEYPYEVRLKQNQIRLRDWLTLPLPPINYLANEEGEPSLGGLRVGQDARFGTVLGFEYNRDVREELGERINRLLGGTPDSYRARFRFNINYFGSRGVLFDPGLRLQSGDNYTWSSALGVIPDDSRDRGLIQVPEDQRDGLRSWFRSRGRFKRGTGEWIDLALTVQSDPGVQSEFFEDDYLRYEERDSFLNWHKAQPGQLHNVIVSGPLNDFNGGIGRLPEYNFILQRREVARLFGYALHHGFDVRVGAYNRHAGDPTYEAPFDDGLGQSDLMRAFQRQRLELPIPLGQSGAIATPFADLTTTGWTESGEDEGEIGRTLGFGGIKLSQVLWRGDTERGWQEIAPSVAIRRDWIEASSSALPLVIDELEAGLTDGEFVDLALRGRAAFPLFPASFDGELRASHAEDSASLEAGWQPIGVFSAIDTSVGPLPIRLAHDGRYDLDNGDTNYSNSLLDLYPRRDLDLQLAFARGRDRFGDPRFEAATIAAVYRFTPKWDIEGRQQYDLLDEGQLGSSIRIKRYGHDLLFELGVRYRAGEGTSFGIGIKPLLSANKRPESRQRLFVE
jgi:hypothetical protein